MRRMNCKYRHSGAPVWLNAPPQKLVTLSFCGSDAALVRFRDCLAFATEPVAGSLANLLRCNSDASDKVCARVTSLRSTTRVTINLSCCRDNEEFYAPCSEHFTCIANPSHRRSV